MKSEKFVCKYISIKVNSNQPTRVGLAIIYKVAVTQIPKLRVVLSANSFQNSTYP